MALALTGIPLQLPSSGHRPSIPLEQHIGRPGHQSQRRFRPLSLPATACISPQLPSSRHRPSTPLPRHLLWPGHLPPLRPRPLPISLSAATAASAFSSAFAAPPWTSCSSHNNQPLDELLETDRGDRDGGSSSRGAVGHHDGDSNRKAALLVPPREWDDWHPPETQLAASDGSERFFELEKSPLLRWLLQFGGIKESLLADDFFLAKVAIECGLGIFSKNFFKEPAIVLADAAMVVVADFMLVHLLPAATASLTPALLARFFHCCPDNAFQIVLSGSSYSLAQRLGAIAVGTAARNALINVWNAVGKSSGGEVENVPILSTGLAHGVYMAIADNLRSQVLNGIIEQRSLEPLLHQHKFPLVAVRFAVRTGNTFLGSLLWIDYAHWVRIQ